MKSNKKKYIPIKTLNPAKQQQIFDDKIVNLFNALQAQSKSFENHISYLGNFARHDMKNSIQSMDSILSTINAEEINDDNIMSLKTNLKAISLTVDNFSKLLPYSQDEKFTLEELFNAVELLNRSTFQKKKIVFNKRFDKEIEYRFSLPFQSILQMLNNLIINAIKSLENVFEPKILMCVSINDVLKIEIFDNGLPIIESKVAEIFKFGYSTTNGSGIGLFHAKYLCEILQGNIELKTKADTQFNKSFLITLPITIT